MRNYSLKEFKNGSLTEQGKMMFLEGKFIASRQYYNQRLVLYSICDFFAEVWYDPHGKKIHRIDVFTEEDKRIDRYIDTEINR